MLNRSKVELLAPAGDEECFKAAIAAGADAVYFGLEQFSARTRAKNLTVEQAKYLIPLAHSHNVRTYLTLNTLIRDDELNDALSLVKKAVECGIDAVIVQDLGILKLIRNCFPELEIHASTQMTTHNISQCKFLSTLGVSQINLSRELSLPEIKKLADYLHSENIVPEIFIQGAFCVSYSGQCYLSGYLYNQAGNRGDCVQPCRREWCVKNQEILENKKSKDYKALFHLKDNSVFSLADKLINETYPVSLKIEGRIKNAEYVWAVTSAWREQIDLVLSGKSIQKSSAKLTGAINRDYTSGYLEGNISANMFSNGTKDISQIKAGIVKNYIADTKTLILVSDNDNLKKDDRLTIKNSMNQFICTAKVTGKVQNGYTIQITNKLSNKILNGQIVYKSSSVITPEALSNIIKKISSESKEKNFCDNFERIHKVDISVRAIFNEPIKISYKCENHEVTVFSKQNLEKAQNAGLTKETLEQKLSKLGETIFEQNSFIVESLDSNLFIPLGELNSLRREAVNLLTEKITSEKEAETQSSNINKNYSIPELKANISKTVSSTEAYLVDNIQVLEQQIENTNFFKKDYKIIYEIPSSVNLVSEKLFDILNQNKNIVLYFNSILIENDLDDTIKFIHRFNNLSEREIICDNTGLAFELKDTGCKIILGPNCNIYNSWNILSCFENLKPYGIIPSLELDTSVIEKIVFPEGLQIWYPKSIQKLLMQSRQCLVKNGSGCTKEKIDRKCIEGCSKSFLISGTQKEEIYAVKRPGFYSALFSAKKENFSSNSEFLKNNVSVWIIDKRF